MPQVHCADFVEFVCVPGVCRDRHSPWPSPGRQPSSFESLPCCEEFEIAASTGGVEAGASILQMREPPEPRSLSGQELLTTGLPLRGEVARGERGPQRPPQTSQTFEISLQPLPELPRYRRYRVSIAEARVARGEMWLRLTASPSPGWQTSVHPTHRRERGL